MASVGIQWSNPVLIQRAKDGTLFATIPEQVAKHFNAHPGDVLNWTLLKDDTVEAWTIQKSNYSSLDDLESPAKAAAAKKSATKKQPAAKQLAAKKPAAKPVAKPAAAKSAKAKKSAKKEKA